MSARSEAAEVGRGPLASAEDATSLLLFGPGSREYTPALGDVVTVAVWRTAGRPVGCPAGWMEVAERERRPWPSGRAGSATATAWYRLVSVNESAPCRVSFRLGVSGSAEGLVVIYRLLPFTCPRCGQAAKGRDDAANGYCQGCRDWTGAAAPRPDQLARVSLSVGVGLEGVSVR